MRFTASRLIQENGSAVTVTYYSADTPNAVTGAVTQSSRTESGYGIVSGYKIFDRGERIEAARHHRVMLQGSMTAPNPGDRIAVDGATYTVVSCSPMKPGDTIVYHEIEVKL